MILQNHSNMMICCSRNTSDYYQCWKKCCLILLKLGFVQKNSVYLKRKIVFTDAFDQFNASLQNKNINFLLMPNLW